jgi:CMP-N,N'-diacetyllegionaminic acid synthase
MNIIGIIPARGGSKGIPRKNIREIAGKPLIAWSIDAARSANLARVIVSTEDPEIAQISQAHGADVPFLRPAELAGDESPAIALVKHAIQELPGFDAIMLLQPTSPLRTSSDIRGCVELAVSSQAQTVASVSEATNHPAWTYGIDEERKLIPLGDPPNASRRQDLPPAYCLNGAMYFSTTAWLREHDQLVAQGTMAYVMPRHRAVDIDDMLDWRIAEMLLKERS